GKKQSRGDQEFGLITHGKVSKPGLARCPWGVAASPSKRPVKPFLAAARCPGFSIHHFHEDLGFPSRARHEFFMLTLGSFHVSAASTLGSRIAGGLGKTGMVFCQRRSRDVC